MKEQVDCITDDMASMVEFKEFVINFEQKEWFGTTSILSAHRLFHEKFQYFLDA